MPQIITCSSCFHCISRGRVPFRAHHIRLCPSCSAELPYDAGLVNQYNIAIIGARATGKTHYLATLIHSLQYKTSEQFGFTIRMQGYRTQKRWEHDFYTPLFLKRTLLQSPSSSEEWGKAPLSLRFTFTQGRTRHLLNISFFDGADTNKVLQTPLSIKSSQVRSTHALILLLDPLQIPEIRRQITTLTLPSLNPVASPESSVKLLRVLFQQEHYRRGIQKIKIPVAFALSKVDTLLPLLEPGSGLHRPSDHAGYVDLNDVQSIHTEIENYFTSWISPEFNRFVHDTIAHYRYFGISALGEPPDDNNRISSISPWRVEDPFLWILYQLKLVRGMKKL